MAFFSQTHEGKSPLPPFSKGGIAAQSLGVTTCGPFSKGGIQTLEARCKARNARALTLRHFPLRKRGIEGDLHLITLRKSGSPTQSRIVRSGAVPLCVRARSFWRSQSLPASLFQREESRSTYAIPFKRHFPLWKRGIEGDLQLTTLRKSGMPAPWRMALAKAFPFCSRDHSLGHSQSFPTSLFQREECFTTHAIPFREHFSLCTRHRSFRRSQSLPASLFQREESRTTSAFPFKGHFPLWKRGIEGDLHSPALWKRACPELAEGAIEGDCRC